MKTLASSPVLSRLPRPRPVVYSAFRRDLRTGDIALSLADGSVSNRLIAEGTRSPYVHATMIGWCGDVLMLAEARQWRESHLVTLSSQVEQWPGLYHVYRVRRPFRPLAAWEAMLRATGTPYGWGQLLREAARKFFGGLVRREGNEAAADFPRDCSALVNYACRAGGRVPRPELADEEVEPGHFADAAFARCIGALYWTEEQADQAAEGAARGLRKAQEQALQFAAKGPIFGASFSMRAVLSANRRNAVFPANQGLLS